MIEISTDNTFIYTKMEKANALPLRFDLDDVIAFDQDDNFYVSIYLSNTRNFICFIASEYIQENNSLIYLQQVVENYSEMEIPVALVDKALELIEHKMHTKNSSRFFFDAH